MILTLEGLFENSNLKNFDALCEITKYLAVHVGQVILPLNISKVLPENSKISNVSIKNYLELLSSPSGPVVAIERFNLKKDGKPIAKTTTYYFKDMGFFIEQFEQGVSWYGTRNLNFNSAEQMNRLFIKLYSQNHQRIYSGCDIFYTKDEMKNTQRHIIPINFVLQGQYDKCYFLVQDSDNVDELTVKALMSIPDLGQRYIVVISSNSIQSNGFFKSLPQGIKIVDVPWLEQNFYFQ